MRIDAGAFRTPEVIGDYDSRQEAEQACERAARQPLTWQPVPCTGLHGAEVPITGGEIIYGTLDRYARAAASQKAASQKAARRAS